MLLDKNGNSDADQVAEQSPSPVPPTVVLQTSETTSAYPNPPVQPEAQWEHSPPALLEGQTATTLAQPVSTATMTQPPPPPTPPPSPTLTSSPQPVATPTETRSPPRRTPTASGQITTTASIPSTAAIDISQGIGLDRTLWEQRHDPAEQQSQNMFSYEQDAYRVVFDDQSQHIWYLERLWGIEHGMPLDEAQQIARRFIPSDSTFLDTLKLSDSSMVDMYHSNWLEGRYTESLWSDVNMESSASPGEFIINYRIQDGRVVSFMIKTGTTPYYQNE
jgi:hypothetical protein